MKKLLVLAALTMAAAPAMASKAKLSALGNASQLVDIQTIFENPSDIHALGDQASFEFGNTTEPSWSNSTGSYTATVPAHAEGGFIHTFNWGKLGVYLGHKDTSATAIVQLANKLALSSGALTYTTTTQTQLFEEQNPLDLFYATDMAGMKVAFGAHYTNSKSDTNARKVSTSGISAGARTDLWDAYLRVGLSGSSEVTPATNTTTAKANGLYEVGGGYNFDTIYAYANYKTVGAKINLNAAGDQDASINVYKVGMVNNRKIDGGNFFYGFNYFSQEVKSQNGSNKVTTSGIPMLVGLEVDANSWMVLRGSITQSVLVGQTKTDTSTSSTTNSMLNDTTVAAGTGIKFNKFMLDASIAAASNASGSIDTAANDFLTNAALTYNF